MLVNQRTKLKANLNSKEFLDEEFHSNCSVRSFRERVVSGTERKKPCVQSAELLEVIGRRWFFFFFLL